MSILEDYRYVIADHGQTCCRFHGSALGHHDSLLRVTDSVVDAVALLDLAVTWAELDHSDSALVPVDQWSKFVATHRWRDRALAQRIFDLAIEIATQSALLAARTGPADDRHPVDNPDLVATHRATTPTDPSVLLGREREQDRKLRAVP